MLSFHRTTASGRDRIQVEIDTLIVAGWTARDAASLQHHIDELAELGVPPPSTVPLYYRIGVGQLSQTSHLQVLGPDSSGEAEPVVVALADGLWVTVGSDHTDRKAEAHGVALSKQLCAKVVGRELWRFDEVAPHWDRLILRSRVRIDGHDALYQEGAIASIRTPQDLMSGWRRAAGAPSAEGDAGSLPAGTLMFCGTLGAIGGIRPAARFEMELEDPVLGRVIRHGYDIEALPVVS